jgi:hypothetical protein
MDDQPKTRKELKGSKTKQAFNQKTIRLKEALLEKAKNVNLHSKASSSGLQASRSKGK